MKAVLPVFFRRHWLGGTNYFLGLVRALREHRDAGGGTVLVLSNDPGRFGLAPEATHVEIRHAPWLDASARPDYFVNGAVNIATRHNFALFHAARRAAWGRRCSPGRRGPAATRAAGA